jgi:trans-aconitate 2-methyltransferase
VISRMRLTGSERVLDAGCGTGRDAAVLLERHPGLDLIGIDGSASMIDEARQRLGDRATLLLADLTEPLPIAAVDAVMSVATFHWISDHAALFANLHSAMGPGARLTSDCGGAGQLANVDAALIAVTGQPKQGIEFAGVAATEANLVAAGFEVERVDLRPDPLRLEDPDLLERYLGAVCLGGYLAALHPTDHPDFLRDVRRAMPEPVIDYIRLEIDAVRR